MEEEKKGPGRQTKEKVLYKGQMSIEDVMDVDYYC